MFPSAVKCPYTDFVLSFEASKSSGSVSAILDAPARPKRLLVLAHGAGTDMRHKWLSELASALVAVDTAVFRYNFPYTEGGRKMPDPKPILMATVRSAVAEAIRQVPGVPVFAGGKSMGGRMASLAEAKEPLGVDGLVFFGFPLHPSGKPGTERAEHLADLRIPMLFLQGTRDALAERGLISEVCERLPTARLHWIEGADHAFSVPRTSGRTSGDVIGELGRNVAEWDLPFCTR